jgi:Sec-independent protein translocase protein TatA
LGIVEIVVLLIVALIVIPPENLPEVARAAGKILREFRLASNTIMRELSGAIEEPVRPIAQPPADPSPDAVEPTDPAERT